MNDTLSPVEKNELREKFGMEVREVKDFDIDPSQCHDDINLVDIQHQIGSFIVTSLKDARGDDIQVAYHVWDISQEKQDQWQQKFQISQDAIEYATSRASGGTFCLLSREGHLLD